MSLCPSTQGISPTMRQMAQDPDGGPCPAYPSDNFWDEAFGKTGSGKKFYHNVNCYWKSLLTLSKHQLVDCITVESACIRELMNNGFAFAGKSAICTEAIYSYTCLATKGTCKASLSQLMEVSRGTEAHPQTARRL